MSREPSSSAPSTQKGRVMLIDGANLFFRAFFAIPSLTNASGMPTNALLGFTNMLVRLLKDERPEYAAIVFDASGPTHRDVLYPEYKANRPSMPQELVDQLPWLPRVAAGFQIPYLCVPGIEADDVMATLAVQARNAGLHACLVSSDKDLAQLVGPNIELLDTMAGRRYDQDAVVDKWKVRPDQIGDYLALVGDSVDNIPGVRGIGAKTAADLLNRFGTLDEIFRHIEQLAPAVSRKLADGAQMARLSRELVQLVTDAPLDIGVSQLRCQPADRPQLTALFRELGFKTLEREFMDQAPESEPQAAVVRSPADWQQALHSLTNAQGPVALLPLGVAEDASRSAWAGLAIARGEHRYFVPAPPPGGGPDLLAVAAKVLALSHEPAITFDTQALWAHLPPSAWPCNAGRVFDVKLASWLNDPDRYVHSLRHVAQDWLARRVELAPEIANKQGGVAPGRAPSVVAGFAAVASGALLSIHEPLSTALAEAGLIELYEQVELPIGRVLAGMRARGVAVDVGRLTALATELGSQLQRLEARAHELAGRTFSLASPKQVGEVLFGDMGLPVLERTATGPSTNAGVLETLAAEHEIARVLVEWRAAAKLKTAYADALPTLVDPRTGRICAAFQQAVASTGRITVSEPNLQAIPVRTAAGRLIRRAFVAPPGCVLVSADYSQIELRLLAHLAGAEALQQAFADGVDIHRATAAEIHGVEASQVTAEQRTAAKAVVFGVLYGMGATRLASDLKIPRKEAQAFIDRYFERFPAVRQWMETTLVAARNSGEVRTLLGRRRILSDLASKNRQALAAAERAAINTPIQGSAADVIKLAMLALEDRLASEAPNAAIVLQVHDELVVEAPEGQARHVAELMRQSMQGVGDQLSLAVPLSVSVQWGSDWSEAH